MVGGRGLEREGGFTQPSSIAGSPPVGRPTALLAALFLFAGASWLGAEEQSVSLKSETSRGVRLPEVTDQILLLEQRIEKA
ncbi:MAG TPA: hypothetical protein VKI41_02600 [Vicinamibacteria bacterium]|nr:hypothetical protein [Vicinamibacteria bacterium]